MQQNARALLQRLGSRPVQDRRLIAAARVENGRRPTPVQPMPQLESIDETRADICKQHHDLVFDRLAFVGVFGF